MRPSPCDDAIMFGPKAQKEGRGIFGRTNVKENVLETTEKIDSYWENWFYWIDQNVKDCLIYTKALPYIHATEKRGKENNSY